MKTDSNDSNGVAGEVKTKEPFRVNIRWGHIDRMPKCKHGRIFCRECGL